jgi:hypothetical protein
LKKKKKSFFKAPHPPKGMRSGPEGQLFFKVSY